jgi:hypothetical protein
MRGTPVSPDTLIDERFDEIVAALRAETPATPHDLRERVAEITATPPAEPRFRARRIIAFAAPAVAGLSLVVAVGVGLNSAIDPGGSGDAGNGGSSFAAEPRARELAPQAGEQNLAPVGTVAADSSAQKRVAVPNPTAGRAQDYNATLLLLVDGTDDLSATTQRALRTTRRLGGYLVSVNYTTPEPGEGTAAVQVRIPVSRVQAAIVQFSGLGRILAQDTRISDLQQPLDELTRQIRRLERRAAVTKGGEREKLLAQIASLRRQRLEINRRAAFATVSLNLTTHEPKEPAATPGRLDRALGDAVGILLAELVIAAYGLIVASPLLLLLAAAFFGNRAYRRHADQQLLERA